MPHVSKKTLRKKVLDNLERQINSLIRDAGAQTRADIFNEILTPTEQLMLAKRLGILFLIKTKVPLETIEAVLGVTRSTIYRFKRALHKNRYHKTADWLWKRSKEGKLDAALESLVSLVFTGRTRTFKKFVDEQ